MRQHDSKCGKTGNSFFHSSVINTKSIISEILPTCSLKNKLQHIFSLIAFFLFFLDHLWSSYIRFFCLFQRWEQKISFYFSVLVNKWNEKVGEGRKEQKSEKNRMKIKYGRKKTEKKEYDTNEVEIKKEKKKKKGLIRWKWMNKWTKKGKEGSEYGRN